jgi:hypothetical protein
VAITQVLSAVAVPLPFTLQKKVSKPYEEEEPIPPLPLNVVIKEVAVLS